MVAPPDERNIAFPSLYKLNTVCTIAYSAEQRHNAPPRPTAQHCAQRAQRVSLKADYTTA